MPESFSTQTGVVDAAPPARRRVLVTGAAGNIGAYFARHAHQRYTLRLMVRAGDERAAQLAAFGEVVESDLADLQRMKTLCADVDTVLHLAGDPDPSATWHSLLDANIVGCYHTFVAAKAAGCRRVVYASSIHAVSGYPADVQVKTSDPVNPGDLYGVTKCFGEALGRYMAEQEGVSVVAIRIGAFQPHEAAENEGSVGMLDAWVSQRDLQQLIERCIDADEVRFALVNGISDNRFKRLDISDARALFGYAPQDDLTDVNPRLKELHLSQEVSAHNTSDERQESGLREEL
jgi:NAD(P)-dependent dehydrogenase (short-subunit alcohol dehydrogenase family)